MEKLIFADDHHELVLSINPEELKNIPFFQGYLSDHFSKDIIHVHNAAAAISSLMEHSTGFKFIYQKLISADYFGIKPNLNVLKDISIPPDEFELLLGLIDYFGYDPILIQAIRRNLPPNYQLLDTLFTLFIENCPKILIHMMNYSQHLVYNFNEREYIHDFSDEYLSQQYKTTIEYCRKILFIGCDIIITNGVQSVCAIDLKTNKIMYRIDIDEIYYYELSYDRKFLLVDHIKYITIYYTNNGQIFKKIMMSGDFVRLSHNSKWILLADDNICRIVDINSDEIIKEFELHYAIQSLKLSYDDKLLAIKEKIFPHTIRIFELDTGKEIFSSNGGGGDYNFSIDSKKILVNTFVLKIYDIYTKETIQTFYSHESKYVYFVSPKEIILNRGNNIYLYNIDNKTQKLIGHFGGTMVVHLML